MAWNEIIGLEREKKILQKALLEGRLAGAYCFLGIEGIGKDAVALELAKTANCYEPIISKNGEIIDKENFSKIHYTVAELNDITITACDKCKSCKMAKSFSHPNIQYVFALPAEAQMTDEHFTAIKEQLALKIADKYHQISIPNAKQIHISLIRTIKKNISLSSAKKGRRFIIISNGDLMNTEAANAFLKTLEEPQLNTTIIITSSKKEKLLQTILSRCQQIFFEPLSNEEIAKYLVENEQKNETQSKLIAAFAQGSITKALEYFDDDMHSMRSEVVDILRIALKRKNYRIELLNAIEKLLEKKDKKIYVVFLNLLLVWIRDVYTISKVQNTDLVINTDLEDRILKFHNGFPNVDLLKALSIIESSINRIEYNIDPKLALISLFIELRKIFLKTEY